MLPKRVLVSVIALAFFRSASASQSAEPLFVVANGASSAPEHEVVGMRLDRLFTGTADRVLLNIADHAWVATLEHIDSDSLGHRVWVGRIDDIQYSHVSFAERDGVVSGLINGLSAVYQIRTLSPGRYAVERARANEPNGELDPLVKLSSGDNGITVSPLRQIASDDRRTIDVLLIYTPGVVTRLGGTAQVQALIAQIISDSNTIFARSGVTTRLRLAGSQEFGLTESASMAGDLTALTDSPAARALRDQVKADLVQLLEESAQTEACGVAWQLTSLGETNFDAYSVADIDCVPQYTPTHEMAHNMGSQHAPEDAPSFALFPYSYGYKDPARGFRTVMAYACTNASCPRIPNMSNPAVLHNGAVTGTDTQNNALSINNAAETVANFRQQTGGTPPGAPSGLRATVIGSFVTLAWNAVTTDPLFAPDAASSYTLQVGSGSGLSNLLSVNLGNTTSVSGTAPAGTYFWRVIAVNSAGQSVPSSESSFSVLPCAAPGPPPTFDVSVAGHVATLAWTMPLAGGPFTSVLEAGSASGLADLFNGNVGAITSLSAPVPPGTYFVRVRAQNACGTGPASIERVVIVP